MDPKGSDPTDPVSSLYLCIFIFNYLYKKTFVFLFPPCSTFNYRSWGVFEQSKSTCDNDALQQILYWFLRRKYSILGSKSNR